MAIQPNPSSPVPCTSCGDQINNIAEAIKKACGYIGNGHAGIAGLYDQLVEVSKDEKSKVMFREAAESHRDMARRTAEVVVPEKGDV